MRAEQLVVRCYAEPEGSQWVAVCVDLSLAAQADSFEEVKAKLDDQIREYVFDALAGEDRAHAQYLMPRKAPLRFRLKYALISAQNAIARMRGNAPIRPPVRFKETLPLVPALC